MKLVFFPPSNVDRSDWYFYMSLLNVYYIRICKLHEKYWILHLQWLHLSFNNNNLFTLMNWNPLVPPLIPTFFSFQNHIQRSNKQCNPQSWRKKKNLKKKLNLPLKVNDFKIVKFVFSTFNILTCKNMIIVTKIDKVVVNFKNFSYILSFCIHFLYLFLFLFKLLELKIVNICL